MMIDWGEAVQIGLLGFGLVFLVLIALAVLMWLVGILTSKFSKPVIKPAAVKADSGSNKDKRGE